MGRGSSAAASNGTFYGRDNFRPAQIVQQLILIQTVFYVSYASLIFFFDLILGVTSTDLRSARGLRGIAPVFVRQMLDHGALSLHTSPGIISAASFVCATVCVAPAAFVALVGRSKSALDFSVTLLLAHLVCCTAYGGFPTSALWWTLVGVCGVVMTLVCELASRRLELRSIAVPTRADVENQAADMPAADDNNSA